jgi:uncharacterized protein YjbJ (UPF0337 family)
MNWDQVEGKWKQLTASIKARWCQLTDDDLNVISGQRDQLIGRIQERYGIAKDEARRQVSQWCVALSHENGDQHSSLVERQAS